MPPAHQQQKRLLLLLKRGRWPYYAAIILRLRVLAMASVVRLNGGND